MSCCCCQQGRNPARIEDEKKILTFTTVKKYDNWLKGTNYNKFFPSSAIALDFLYAEFQQGDPEIHPFILEIELDMKLKEN